MTLAGEWVGWPCDDSHTTCVVEKGSTDMAKVFWLINFALCRVIIVCLHVHRHQVDLKLWEDLTWWEHQNAHMDHAAKGKM
jgi:hypothetical protein